MKEEKKLNVQMTFAGCDITSLKRSSNEEAESVLANTNIKFKITKEKESFLKDIEKLGLNKK